jgi:hypothetical protein
VPTGVLAEINLALRRAETFVSIVAACNVKLYLLVNVATSLVVQEDGGFSSTTETFTVQLLTTAILTGFLTFEKSHDVNPFLDAWI